MSKTVDFDDERETANEDFSKDVDADGFYVPGPDLIPDEFDLDPNTFEADLRRASEKIQKTNDQPPESKHADVEEPLLEKKADFIAESDFFDQPVAEDEEKGRVVEEISGMAEVSEEQEETDEVPSEEVPTKEEDRSILLVQFKDESGLEIPEEEPLERSLGEPEKVEVATSKTPSRRERPSVQSRTSEAGARSPPRRSSVDESRTLTKSDTETGELDQASLKAIARESYALARRGTIAYEDFAPRIKITEDYDDFMGFDMGGDLPFEFDAVSEVEEASIVEEEEQGPVLNRKPYYERHDQASEQMGVRRLYNFVLQKKLAIYFRRKKMDYVTRETDWSFDQQVKYGRKLEAYGELIEFDAGERARLSGEIDEMKKQRDKKLNELTTKFDKMQSRENEVGFGLIFAKTGNAIADKHVERLVHRQSLQMGQVSSMRLTFIRLKQMVQEKLDRIDALDEIAPGFLLADFEQLKIMGQSYADKLEEKDESLARLRAKCTNTIQILAHLREKTAALKNDLADLNDDYEDVELMHVQYRSRLNSLKQERDVYRHNTDKIRSESGLLTQPKLLMDMEQGLIDVRVLSANLELVMKDYKKRAKQIKIIRKKIEETKEQRRVLRKSTSKVRSSQFVKKGLSTIYKGRPSLMIPDIPDKAFESLKAIKPKITYDRSRYHTGIKHNKRTGG